MTLLATAMTAVRAKAKTPAGVLAVMYAIYCAVLAVVPSFFAGEHEEPPSDEPGGRRLLEDLELWWSVLRGHVD